MHLDLGTLLSERTVYPTTQVSLANCRLVEPVLGKHCSTTGNVKRWLEALTPRAFQHLPLNHTYHFLLNLPTHLNGWFGQFESTPSVPVKVNPFQANSSITKTFSLVCSESTCKTIIVRAVSDPHPGICLCIADTMQLLLNHAVSNQ